MNPGDQVEHRRLINSEVSFGDVVYHREAIVLEHVDGTEVVHVAYMKHGKLVIEEWPLDEVDHRGHNPPHICASMARALWRQCANGKGRVTPWHRRVADWAGRLAAAG